jgi:hypothetical protein|tara:strand:+ start:97 stop:309 length:213 start_codon:yes stop_codon:yes gene_type:complete
MLAIMKHSVPQLLRLDFEGLMHFMRDVPSKIDGPVMMERALKIELKQSHIEYYKVKYKKMREAEEKAEEA